MYVKIEYVARGSITVKYWLPIITFYNYVYNYIFMYLDAIFINSYFQ